jgi:uncharacterized membrane protein YhaH (DUF805 family)
MNMDTKRCPRCGEEILAVARKCKYCGEWITEQTPKRTKTCRFCAEEIDESSVVCPICKSILIEQTVSESIAKPPLPPIHKQRSNNKAVSSGWFTNYFINVIRFQYADFTGTATRKEYWIYALFMGLLGWLLGSIYILFLNDIILLLVAYGLSACVSLAFFVPTLANAIRRLHDIGKSGWWMLIILIPIVGVIWFFILMCQKGRTTNKRVTSTASDIIIIVASVLLTFGIYAYGLFPKDNNENAALQALLDEIVAAQASSNERAASRTPSNESETTQTPSVENINLITRTSIAGIEIIGKTPNEVRPNINDNLIWEYIEKSGGQAEGYLIKDGEDVLFRFYLSYGRISATEIYTPFLATKDGLHVGSTAGDVLKLYPRASVRSTGMNEYATLNEIFYIFDSESGPVGNYSSTEQSPIINKDIPIRAIMIMESSRNNQTNNQRNNQTDDLGSQVSKRLLTENDLAGLSKVQLRILRNEVFARRGYIFKAKELHDYFSKQSWYYPLYDDISDQLTPLEIENIKFIKQHE